MEFQFSGGQGVSFKQNLKFLKLEFLNLKFPNLEFLKLEFLNLKFPKLEFLKLKFLNLKFPKLEFLKLEFLKLEFLNQIPQEFQIFVYFSKAYPTARKFYNGYALNRRLTPKTPLKSRILLLYLRFWGNSRFSGGQGCLFFGILEFHS